MKILLVALTFFLIPLSESADKKEKFLELYGQTSQRWDELSEKDFKITLGKFSQKIKNLDEKADSFFTIPGSSTHNTDVSKKGIITTVTTEGRYKGNRFENKIMIRQRDAEGNINKESELELPAETRKENQDTWDVEFRLLEVKVHSESGKIILLGTYERKKVLHIVETDTQKSIFKMEVSPSAFLSSYLLSQNGKFLIGIQEKKIRLWEVSTGKEISNRFTPLTSLTNSLVISPDGSKIAVGTYKSEIQIFNFETGKLESSLTLKDENADNQYSNGIVMAFSPSGEQLLVSEYASSAHLWNLNSGKKIRSLKINNSDFDDFGRKSYPLSIDFHPQGDIAFIRTGERTGGSRNVELSVWNLREGKSIYSKNFYGLGFIKMPADGSFLFLNSHFNNYIWKLK